MFSEVFHHRLKYFLTPQADLYKNIRDFYLKWRERKNMVHGGCNILDYGCGTGAGTIMLHCSRDNLEGFDVDPTAIAFARDVWGHLAEFTQANWSIRRSVALSQMEPDKYDMIVCVEVIEHIDDPQALLESFRLALHPGGLLFISTLNHNSQYRKNHCHVGKYHIEDFRALLRNYWGGVRITDYTLTKELTNESSITPMVGIWEDVGE